MRPGSFLLALSSMVLGGIIVTLFHLGEYDQGYSLGYQKGRDAQVYVDGLNKAVLEERQKSMGLCWYATNLCRAHDRYASR